MVPNNANSTTSAAERKCVGVIVKTGVTGRDDRNDEEEDDEEEEEEEDEEEDVLVSGSLL